MDPIMFPTVEIEKLVSQATKAQSLWQETPVGERLRNVKEFRFQIVEQKDRLLEAVQHDISKRPEETLGAELLPLAEACRFLEKQSHQILRPRKIGWLETPLWMSFQNTVVHRHPRGIVGIIGTWNYPILLNGVQILQALVAGNAVLWKPSENAVRTAEVLLDIFRLCKFPDGLFQALEPSPAAGKALVEAPIQFLIMTGGASTGKIIAKNLAERLVPSVLELSGNDAFLVCDDADFPLAAKAAWFAATINHGQTCMAGRRILVPKSRAPEFIELIKSHAQKSAPKPLVMSSQAEVALKVIRDSLRDGAKLEWPATGVDSIFQNNLFAPVLLSGILEKMAFAMEATFVPIMGVMEFENLDDAIRIINNCPFGLCASIFSQNIPQAKKLAQQIHCGGISINDTIAPHAHPATPFGGTGQSGWGITQGMEGLLELTVPKTVSVARGKFRPHYDLAMKGAPNPKSFLENILYGLHGKHFWKRFTSWLAAMNEGRKL